MGTRQLQTKMGLDTQAARRPKACRFKYAHTDSSSKLKRQSSNTLKKIQMEAAVFTGDTSYPTQKGNKELYRVARRAQTFDQKGSKIFIHFSPVCHVTTIYRCILSIYSNNSSSKPHQMFDSGLDADFTPSKHSRGTTTHHIQLEWMCGPLSESHDVAFLKNSMSKTSS